MYYNCNLKRKEKKIEFSKVRTVNNYDLLWKAKRLKARKFLNSKIFENMQKEIFNFE